MIIFFIFSMVTFFIFYLNFCVIIFFIFSIFFSFIFYLNFCVIIFFIFSRVIFFIFYSTSTSVWSFALSSAWLSSSSTVPQLLCGHFLHLQHGYLLHLLIPQLLCDHFLHCLLLYLLISCMQLIYHAIKRKEISLLSDSTCFHEVFGVTQEQRN